MAAEAAQVSAHEARMPIAFFPTLHDPNFIEEAVKRIEGMSLSELERKVPELVQTRGRNAFLLGGMLERVRREKFWNPGAKQPQNALFERWVEATCQFSGRKARYLVAVYLGLVGAAIPSSQVRDIGWSKLRMIAPLLKPIAREPDADEQHQAHNAKLLRLARRNSRRELEQALKAIGEEDATNGAFKRAVRKYVFTVTADAADAVDRAFQQIEARTGRKGAAAFVEMASAIMNTGGVPDLEMAMQAAGSERCQSAYLKLFGNSSRPS